MDSNFSSAPSSSSLSWSEGPGFDYDGKHFPKAFSRLTGPWTLIYRVSNAQVMWIKSNVMPIPSVSVLLIYNVFTCFALYASEN